MWGDQVESLAQIDPLFGQVKQSLDRLPIYPRTHYVLPADRKEDAIEHIKSELEWWRGELEKQGKLVEAQRVHQRTMFDLEMMKEMGYCHGIENYSRHLSGRLPGEPPPTLLDYLPQDAMMFLDESHQSCRSFAGCITATAHASRRWWNTVFACRRRSITVRSLSKSLSIVWASWFMFPPPPGPMS